ncbi:MAG: hypothetical protein WC565_03755 [Parcubacteria group bacterium]
MVIFVMAVTVVAFIGLIIAAAVTGRWELLAFWPIIVLVVFLVFLFFMSIGKNKDQCPDCNGKLGPVEVDKRGRYRKCSNPSCGITVAVGKPLRQR